MIRCIHRMRDNYDNEFAALLELWWPTMYAERIESKKIGTLTGLFASVAKEYCEEQEASEHLCLSGAMSTYNFDTVDRLIAFMNVLKPFTDHIDDHVAYLDRVGAPQVGPDHFQLLACECYTEVEMLEAIHITDDVLSDLRTLIIWMDTGECETSDYSRFDDFDINRCCDFVISVATFECLFEHRNNTIKELLDWNNLDDDDYMILGFEYFLAHFDWQEICDRDLVPHFRAWIKSLTTYSYYDKWVKWVKWVKSSSDPREVCADSGDDVAENNE